MHYWALWKSLSRGTGPALGVPKNTDISKKTDDLWIWNCLVLSLTVLIMTSLQKSCGSPHHPSESPFFVWQPRTNLLIKAVLIWNYINLGDTLCFCKQPLDSCASQKFALCLLRYQLQVVSDCSTWAEDTRTTYYWRCCLHWSPYSSIR